MDESFGLYHVNSILLVQKTWERALTHQTIYQDFQMLILIGISIPITLQCQRSWTSLRFTAATFEFALHTGSPANFRVRYPMAEPGGGAFFFSCGHIM